MIRNTREVKIPRRGFEMLVEPLSTSSPVLGFLEIKQGGPEWEMNQ
jgi:hypothetical protein